MSSRLMHMLLKLYPRRIRDRYGAELLDLQSELEAHGELSRTRLIRDMLAGALLVRPGRQRTPLVIGVVLVVVAVAAGTVIGTRGADPRPRASHLGAPVTLRAFATPPTCFVVGGSACSLTPCTELIGQPSAEDAVASRSLPATQQRVRASGVSPRRGPPNIVVPARAHCTANPQVQPQRPIFVDG